MPEDSQPTPRRRRLAPPVADPMSPYAGALPPTAGVAAPVESPAAARAFAPAPAGEAPPAALPAPSGRDGRRRTRSTPTVPVFLRTSEESKEQFEALANASGLTQRAMFEQLVAQAWTEHQSR